MVRIAAVGDVHLGVGAGGSLRPRFAALPDEADLLLVAGDLTVFGTVEEAWVAAGEFADLGVPVVAVLGNHDHQADAAPEITELLRAKEIIVLDGDGVVVVAGGVRVGVAGVKGFGGGFGDTRGHAFGERAVKDFLQVTADAADRLRAALVGLPGDPAGAPEVTIALTHYAPVAATVAGEPPQLYPFLGSSLLAKAIDEAAETARVDLAVHGHAHFGTETGTTPGGVPVRNVARPVIRAPYRVYEL